MTQILCNDYFCTKDKGDFLEVGVRGQWTIKNVSKIEKLLNTIDDIGQDKTICFQCDGLKNIDTSGAWVLYKKYKSFADQGLQSEFKGFQEKHFRIVTAVLESPKGHCPKEKFGVSLTEGLIKLGKLFFKGCHHLGQALSFLGQLFVTMGKAFVRPKRLRFTSIVRHVHETGINAIPIVAMIAFLFSIVLSYQGAVQLRQFGAEVFMVNLTSVSVLREVAVLMTAILVAGRTGSAYAAELGVMKIREEVDALETMGADIFEMLIVPRVLALIIALPLLVVIANIIGLTGGGLMAYTLIDMPPTMYMERLLDAVTINDFLVGLVKAPVFAFLIATVGTFRGLQVTGAADSIGKYTTFAVVQSIFLIIVADAFFTIIFERIGV